MNDEFHDYKAKQALVTHSVKTMSAWNMELMKSRLSQIQDSVQRGAYPRDGGSKTEANSSIMGFHKHWKQSSNKSLEGMRLDS